MKYAMLLLLGPGQREIERLIDLLKSLIFHEKTLAELCEFVIVNDGNAMLDQLQSYCGRFKKVHVIDNPLYGKSKVLFDRHTAGMIGGFQYIYSNVAVDFVVKVDTDVMCLNSFSDRVASYFSEHPLVGMAGTYLTWPIGGSRQLAFDDGFSRVKNVHHKSFLKNLIIALMQGNFNSLKHHFMRRKIFRKALENGYSYGVHIMGGSYAVSGVLLRTWGDAGFLSQPLLFARSYLGEDSVMTILAFSVGKKLGCFNHEGEVFGVWYKEPEYPADFLQEKGYALIHSIKCVNPEDEELLRDSYRKLAS